MEERGREREVYAGFLMCPSGHIEIGETHQQALFREMQEELGIQVTDAVPLFSLEDVDPHSRREFLHSFMLVKSYRGLVKRSKEAKKMRWLTYAQVKRERTAPIVHKLAIRLRDRGLF